jgi:hypothetical protein
MIVTSIVSVVIALSALSVTISQVRATGRQWQRQNALPIISEIFREWRSEQFREHRSAVLRGLPVEPTDNGFEAFPPEWRESAYTVSYFFDYLGTLVAFELARADLIIGVMGTQIMQVWRILEPAIHAERRHREQTYPSDTPSGFLSYFEGLVKKVIEMGGKESATGIRKRLGVPSLASPLETAQSQKIMTDIPPQVAHDDVAPSA